MATAVVDVDYLSRYLSVPQQTLNAVIDTPTAELVRSVLAAVTAKAREHDELGADKLRAEIELENAVRSSETRIEGLRSNVEKAQKTVEEVRTKLKEEENARSSLENELQTQKSSSSTSNSTLETLRARICSLESANRDTVALLESKGTANDALALDLQKQHQKGLELGQQISTLQQACQIANSAASSAKFREQSLKQEVELAKQNNEWFENELKTKSAEAQRYRKEKTAQLTELQSRHDSIKAELDSLKRGEVLLKAQIGEVQKKAEESLSKVQQLQEAAAQSSEGFRQELESSRRLAELQTQQTETHRSRLREVEEALEKAKDDAADEVGRCRQEIEVERQDREKAELRIAELESEVDRLEVSIQTPRQASVPGTPRQGPNGSVLGRSGSPAPFGSPSALRGKGAITATQALDELYKVKAQLSSEKRKSERLTTEMDSMLQDLEARRPEFEEMQTEHARLQQEVVEMSKAVDSTSKERDRARKDLRKAESEASTSQAEAKILRQQLRDLSVQIRLILADIDARERGLDALNESEQAEFERLARGEIGEEALEGLTDTDRLISQRLTVFRNVSELQEKNLELLKITRQLGAQMESEEALAAKTQAAQDHQEVQELQAKIESYKDELQSMLTRSESYIRERDMFRRMLQHRGQLPPNSDLASVFGQSVDGNQGSMVESIENTTAARDNANYAALLREQQAHFDQYREEQATDRRTMKEQADKLSLDKSSLQAEVARISSQYTLASERYDLLQSNFVLLQSENSELQKRSGLLSEAAAKQDLRTQQVAEDLIEAQGRIESLRNESANLKAEKKLWKDIQERLSQDNEGLLNERTRLNSLVTNQQNLQNERELSESETRRRLQSQVESLEAELTTTKRNLVNEIEDNKKAQLRKEYDTQQNQKRIDDLAVSLSQSREELVAAKTTRDHLQMRVDELTIELKSAEERVVLLQPRPTPRPGTHTESSSNIRPDEPQDREQELAIENSELKRDLDLARSELEGAKNQMEQYKSISQSSEEELQSLNATQDQYREDMDRLIEEKDTKIQELQQRSEDIAAELTNTNNELTSMRNEQSDITRQIEESKASLEAEITRLREEDEKHATSAQFHQQDLRAQAAIATKAQQDYENELVKHADAAKLLQTLRAEHNHLKSEVATIKADAESAKAALSQDRSSWEERRQHFESEVKELRARRDDVNAQNKILHQQLENVGAQISSLQQSRTSLGGGIVSGSQINDEALDRNADGLRELNSFLRREKEIVEVQYDLKVQEAKRLQQQLEYAQSQLDDTRLKLDQERRIHANGTHNSESHKDLLEKITELNLFRESSITLRNESRQAQTQLAEKTKRVEELVEQIQPLETKIRELEHSKESMDGEIQLLRADRDRWQKRTQDIMSKYDRIDPAEMEQLKQTIDALRTERDSLAQEQVPLTQKVQEHETEKAAWTQTRQKLVDQAKERNRVNTITIKDRTSERDTAIQDKLALEQQLSALQHELRIAVQEKEATEQRVTILTQEIATATSEREKPLATNPIPTTDAAAAPEQLPDAANEHQLLALGQERDNAIEEKRVADAQLQELRERLEKAITDKDAAIADALEARSKQPVPGLDGPVEVVLGDNLLSKTPNGDLTDGERQLLESRIAEAESKAKEQEEKANRIEAEMETTLKTRSDKMKAALNKRLTDSKETQKAELRAEFEADFKLRLEQERKILEAESKVTETIPATIPPLALAEMKPASGAAVVASPAKSNQESSLAATVGGMNLTDSQVRDFLASNSVVKQILSSNIKKKVDIDTAKIKEEQEKVTAMKLAEAQQSAEHAKIQAVLLEGKKSALRINMADNKAKLLQAKVDVVKNAAQETPEKPVAEVWEIVQAYKLPPPAPAPTVTLSGQANGTSSIPTIQPSEFNPDAPATAVAQIANQPPPVSTSTSAGATGSAIPSTATSSIPAVPQAGTNSTRPSGIPMARGGNNNRGGRGGPTQLYQPGRGGSQPGRGRGGPGPGPGGVSRGGLNGNAAVYSPTGPAGQKRSREEGSFGGPQQGTGGKRPRGGGG